MVKEKKREGKEKKKKSNVYKWKHKEKTYKRIINLEKIKFV